MNCGIKTRTKRLLLRTGAQSLIDTIRMLGNVKRRLYMQLALSLQSAIALISSSASLVQSSFSQEKLKCIAQEAVVHYALLSLSRPMNQKISKPNIRYLEQGDEIDYLDHRQRMSYASQAFWNRSTSSCRRL